MWSTFIQTGQPKITRRRIRRRVWRENPQIGESVQAPPNNTSATEAEQADLSKLRNDVLGFLVGYLRIESADAENALRLQPGSFAEFASYHGRICTRKEIELDFANYVKRWPVRNYAMRMDTATVSCLSEQQRCVVDAIIDWELSSLSRNAKSEGASSWRVTVSREGGAFHITAIDSKMIERRQSKFGQRDGRCVGLSCFLP